MVNSENYQTMNLYGKYYWSLLGLFYAHHALAESVYFDPTLPPQLSVQEAQLRPIKPKPKPIDYNSIMKLDMIVQVNHQRYCVINEDTYAEGDHVGIYVIQRILADRVVLTNGSEKLWLCIVTDKETNQCY